MVNTVNINRMRLEGKIRKNDRIRLPPTSTRHLFHRLKLAVLEDGLLLQVAPVTLAALHLLRVVVTTIISLLRMGTTIRGTMVKETVTLEVRASTAILAILAILLNIASKAITMAHKVVLVRVTTGATTTIEEATILVAVTITILGVTMDMIVIDSVSAYISNAKSCGSFLSHEGIKAL